MEVAKTLDDEPKFRKPDPRYPKDDPDEPKIKGEHVTPADYNHPDNQNPLASTINESDFDDGPIHNL